MAHIKMQDEDYYVVLKGCRETQWLADERVKKQFLNHLLKVKNKNTFRVYAFCILDKEAHFLLRIPGEKNIELITGKMSRELQRSYLAQYPNGKETAKVAASHLPRCSYAALLEYCCRIHLLARGCAGRIQDYWWSSYMDYLQKNVTGLVETKAILSVLDAEPHRAVQKFIRYHERYSSLIENESGRKK